MKRFQQFKAGGSVDISGVCVFTYSCGLVAWTKPKHIAMDSVFPTNYYHALKRLGKSIVCFKSICLSWSTSLIYVNP